jgi:hypothetical protein
MDAGMIAGISALAVALVVVIGAVVTRARATTSHAVSFVRNA